jgi:cation transporter-like permease
MPRHDPVPPRQRPEPDRQLLAWQRYFAMMRWMALVAVVAALLALIYLKSFGDPVPVHMMIATIAGVGFTILVGTGLMGLVFLSSRAGYDDEATQGDAQGGSDDDDDQR